MKFLKILIVLIILGVVMFFILGLMSQRGQAKGLVDGRLAACPSSPNCASSENDTPDNKKVAPLEGSMSAARDAIVAIGGVITSESDQYISAEFKSKVFGFVDDVELRPGANGTVHIRSASRVGYSDRGVNKQRIAAIRAKMNS